MDIPAERGVSLLHPAGYILLAATSDVSPKDTSTMRLDELFREDSEIAGLLEAYDAAYGPPPASALSPLAPRALRERLIEITDEIGPARVVALLVGFAQGFARMAQAICDLCAETGIGIDGQIRWPTDHTKLHLAPLDSAWAYGGSATWSDDRVQQANALATQVDEITQSLSPQEFLHKESTRDPLYSASTDPRERIYARTFRRRTHQSFAEADVRIIYNLLSQIKELAGRLSSVQMSPALSSAVADLEQRAAVVLREMHRYEIDSRPANDELQTIAVDFESTAAAITRLAQRATEGRRVEKGLADFLRTDFWPQRWRVYELWLLVRVLRLLQANGGRIELLGVTQGVWTLHYSRSSKPVATCETSKGKLEIYYQLFQTARTQTNAFAQKADMPDIAIKRQDGPYLFILDPKHGTTYSRSQMQRVLDRYLRLGADVTAVVNYMDLPSYRFEAVRTQQHTALLASDVAPDRAGIAALERVLCEHLRATGYAQEHPSGKVTPMAPDRKPPLPARLLYWARERREVDEPAGLWQIDEEGGPAPFHGPEGDPHKVKIEALYASAQGHSCAIETAHHFALITDSDRNPAWVSKHSFHHRAEWSPDGQRLVIGTSDSILVLDQKGHTLSQSAMPHLGFCWLDNELMVLLCSWVDNRIVRIVRSTDCNVLHECKVTSASSDALIRLDSRNVLVGKPGDFRLRIDAEGHCNDVEWDSTVRKILAVSPNALYRVLAGPPSLRADAGVKLLTIEDTTDPTTKAHLVRFTGTRIDRFAWSPDESRVAFLTRGEDGQPRLMSFRRQHDRHAATLSMSGQHPSHFAWLTPSLITQFQNNWDRLTEPNAGK